MVVLTESSILAISKLYVNSSGFSTRIGLARRFHHSLVLKSLHHLVLETVAFNAFVVSRILPLFIVGFRLTSAIAAEVTK